MSRSRSWVTVASWTVAAVPAALTGVTSIAAGYIRLSLGRWPIVYHDHVHAPFAGLAIGMATVCVLALLPSLLLFPAMVVIRTTSRTPPVLGWWAVCFAITWLAAFALIKWEPTGFLDWLID